MTTTTAVTETTTVDAVTAQLSRIWTDLLDPDAPLDHDTSFLRLGGDSVLAVRMAALIRKRLGVVLALSDVSVESTIGELASLVRHRANAGRQNGRCRSNCASAPTATHRSPCCRCSRVAGTSGRASGRGLDVYVGCATENLPHVLATAWAGDAPVETHVDAVVAAARHDVEEYGRHYTVLAHARPPAGSTGGSCRVALRIPDPHELSGVVAAIAAVETAAGLIPAGAHHTADVLDPQRTADQLATDELVTGLELPTRKGT